MNNSQIIEKLNTLVNAKNENRVTTKASYAYKAVLKAINGDGVIKPIYQSGSGSWSGYADHTKIIIQLLDGVGLSYTTSNVALRGGKEGNRITIQR